MRALLVLAFLLAQTLQFSATAQPLSFGQLCRLIITNPRAIPKSQTYVVPKVPQSNQPFFGGDITTCVIHQMAANNIHQQNWDYSKQAVQWYNQQARARRDAIAADVSRSGSQYPDLKALVELDYVEIKKSTTGHYVALGSGPSFK